MAGYHARFFRNGGEEMAEQKGFSRRGLLQAGVAATVGLVGMEGRSPSANAQAGGEKGDSWHGIKISVASYLRHLMPINIAAEGIFALGGKSRND